MSRVRPTTITPEIKAARRASYAIERGIMLKYPDRETALAELRAAGLSPEMHNFILRDMGHWRPDWGPLDAYYIPKPEEELRQLAVTIYVRAVKRRLSKWIEEMVGQQRLMPVESAQVLELIRLLEEDDNAKIR